MVCGVRCLVCGVWCVVCGVWCVVCGVWCVVCGVWCVVCGVWCVVCGVWCVVCVCSGNCDMSMHVQQNCSSECVRVWHVINISIQNAYTYNITTSLSFHSVTAILHLIVHEDLT